MMKYIKSFIKKIMLFLYLGVTLDKLDIFTTNEHWHPFFIDRTNPDLKNAPMHKLLKLSNLGI
jgi:hypothetical protein